MDKDDVTLSHPITTIYNKNTSVLQPHVGCLKRAKKEENVLQNILHLLKFTFWASLLSKPQRTTLVASKKCHTAVVLSGLQASTACNHVWTFSLCKLEVPKGYGERSAWTKFTFFSFLRTKQKSKRTHIYFLLQHLHHWKQEQIILFISPKEDKKLPLIYDTKRKQSMARLCNKKNNHQKAKDSCES